MVKNENLRERFYGYTVQCVECLKWRPIPTIKEFEEIRANVSEDPFTCKKLKLTCDDPGDMKPDSSIIWAFDEAGAPKTPPGFDRDGILRKDCSQLDVFYVTPEGMELRNSAEVAMFLEEYPEYKESVSVADFSFTPLKVMAETIPEDYDYLRRVCVKT